MISETHVWVAPGDKFEKRVRGMFEDRHNYPRSRQSVRVESPGGFQYSLLLRYRAHDSPEIFSRREEEGTGEGSGSLSILG
jgi:hypothetical protein